MKKHLWRLLSISSSISTLTWCTVLTISWVPTHSGPGRFSPAPAWTTLALAWDRPSCPCLKEKGRKQTVWVRHQMAGRRHWCHTDRDWHRQCNDSQARMSSLRGGEVEGWTRHRWALSRVILKDDAQKMAWSYGVFFFFSTLASAYARTQTHTQTYTSLQSWVCVTQFGLRVRCRYVTTSSYQLSVISFLIHSGRVVRKTTQTQQSAAKTSQRR